MPVKAIRFKKILYTTDLSDTALHAFSYAVSLANCYGAQITILHVLSDQASVEPYLAGILSEEQLQAIQERHRDEAREALIGKSRENVVVEEALSQFAENVQEDPQELSFNMDEVLVLRGDPAEKILEVAHEFNFDLIVMGTHGRGLIKDMLGSTAKKVAQRSEVPVLSIRLNE
ncbi:MAG: universal stress protein [Thermodesulfobacteriota bacterium]